MVFLQNGNMRRRNLLQFTLYDDKYRPVVKGMCKGPVPSSLPRMTVKADCSANGKYARYDTSLQLDSASVLQAWYYDDYRWLEGESCRKYLDYRDKDGYSKLSDIYYEPTTSNTMLTGERVYETDSGKYVVRAYYHNINGQLIQTHATNLLGGLEHDYYLLNTYNGAVLLHRHEHTVGVNMDSTACHTIETEVFRYTYDKQWRLMDTYLTLNDSPERLIGGNGYDELGRVSEDRGASPLLRTKKAKASSAIQLRLLQQEYAYCGDYIYQYDYAPASKSGAPAAAPSKSAPLVLSRLNLPCGYVTDTRHPSYNLYILDHLGNVRCVLSDSLNRITQVNSYYPFGGFFGSDRNENRQQWRYGGKEYEELTASYDFHARQYDPALGRFTSVDPMAEKYYSVSPYAYCGNDPIDRFDVNGDTINVIGKNESAVFIPNNNIFQDSFVSSTINRLQELYNDKKGKLLLDCLVNSKNNYLIRYGKSIDEARADFDVSNLTITYDGNDLFAFAEELFHVYQYDKGRFQRSPAVEVEAKLFSAVANGEIYNWNYSDCFRPISGTGSYADYMKSLILDGYDKTTFDNAVNSFFTGSGSGNQYKALGYKNMPIIYPPLIEEFIPID